MNYILFVKQTCPYCVKAQDLLKDKGLKYKVVEFEPPHESVLQQIKDAHGWSTVPMIFCKSADALEFVGGYTDLLKFLETDE